MTDDAANFDRARIVQAMVGRDLSNTLYGTRKTTVRPAGARVLTVQNLKMAPMVKNNSLSVFAGQITGVFGLVGAGRTETFKVVAGVLKRDFFHGGEVILHDKPVRYRVPAPAVRAGIAYVTEDRKVEGFFETMSVARNIYLGLLAKLPGGRFFLSRREADKVGRTWVEKLKVRATGNDMKVVELSGGNQQKVVIAKSLVQDPDLIIFDEPTRGVDVGAIVEIHELIQRLADEGKAVVVISSYLPEIMALSDRILVSRQGKVVEEFSALEATEEKIMYAAVHWCSISWHAPLPLATLALTVLAVNARHILLGASLLAPWLLQIPVLGRLAALLWLSDANFAQAMSARQRGEIDAGTLFGSGMTMWVFWIAGTAVGALAGSLLGDVSRFGFDAVMVAYFAAVIIGQWKGTKDLFPWLAAAAVAVIGTQ